MTRLHGSPEAETSFRRPRTVGMRSGRVGTGASSCSASAGTYTRRMEPLFIGLLPVSLDPNPVIEAYKKDVDRTLLRQNLLRTPEERWRTLTAALRLAEEMRKAGAKARGG